MGDGDGDVLDTTGGSDARVLYEWVKSNDRHEPHHILEQSGESAATRVAMEKQTDQKECSICGDVGFPEELFLCHKCRKRFQHRYCSRWYLKLSPQARNWVCEWCLSAAAPESDSGKPMIITSAVTPCKAAQFRLIAADDDRAKNSNKRSCALDDVQLDHQAGSNGAILKRRRKSSSSQRVIAGISASGSSRRFRSLQSLLWIME